MKLPEMLQPEDLEIEPQEVLEAEGYEFSEEELALIDERDVAAERALREGTLISLEDAFAKLRSKYRLAG